MVKVLNNEVEITFKKRTLMALAMQDKIESVVEPASFDTDIFRIFASNFCSFLSRTESIKLVSDNASEIAKDWVQFWDYADGRTDYDNLFMAYMSQCHESINNVWLEAYTQNENSDPLRNPVELSSPENVPDELLADPDVKKSESIDDTA